MQAALRECEEETGLIARVTDLLGVYHIRSDPRGPNVLILYRPKIAGGTLRAGDDAAEAGFFAPDELPSNIAFASTKRALSALILKPAPANPPAPVRSVCPVPWQSHSTRR